MKRSGFCFVDVTLWGLVVYLILHVPLTEMRLNVDEMHSIQTTNKEVSIQTTNKEQPQAVTKKPPEPDPPQDLKLGKCFHMPRSRCPTEGQDCVRVDTVSVFCCDVDSNKLRDVLPVFLTQNTTNLHISNPNIADLNVSAAIFRRLASMALTDGNIGKIVGQYPKHSSIACLNISNNNLTTAKLEPSSQRPFAYLFNLTVLDASANNLTEFPLSLVQSNRKISVDFSGNDYLPCKHFQRAMEANNSSLVTFINYEDTKCALDLAFNWFKDVQIVPIDHLRKQKALNESCRNIRPAHINCTCVPHRLQLPVDGGVTNMVAVDCSQRHLKEMPTNLPANTLKLNVSFNNITSLQAVGDDPTYEDLQQLIVDNNDISSIIELEGSKFIDNFVLFSITNNKLKTIQTYVLSNKLERVAAFTTFLIGGNYIHCDCNTEKVLKPWLLENFRTILDYKSLQCQDKMGPVVDLLEFQVCHTPRDWSDYIYCIIWLEVLVLVLLVSKVSYDYWIFKTAGYLPWPANKMPRLPCDWLCE